MNELIHQDTYKNQIKLSKFQNFSGQSQFQGFSLKLVLKGQEDYYLKQEKLSIKQGYYLLSSSQEQAQVCINQTSIGLCLDLSFDFIAQIQETKNWLAYLQNPYFPHYIRPLNQGKLGAYLMKLNVNKLPETRFSTVFFEALGQVLFEELQPQFEVFSSLAFKRELTQYKLAEQLAWLKNYLDENFLNNPKLDDLARLACMSKFNLIRLFKASFGLSPHQYLLKKRLAHAEILLDKAESIQELAWFLGFADGASFSKAFKQSFGYPPSKKFEKSNF